MKKFFKIALIVVGAVIVLIVAAALLVPRLVDPNQYKDRLSGLVKEKTGRDLAITGDISVSVFPWLGAQIGAVELGNAPGFEAESFASVRQVKVKVKLLPLLSKKVEAGVVSIQGLVLNLELGADGRTNWEDLTASSGAPAEKTPETAPTDASALAALAVGGLDIEDARVTWTDRLSEKQIVLTNLAVKTSAVNLVDPVDMNIRFDLDTGSLGLAASVDTGARIDYDLAGGRYAAKSLAFKADLSGEAIPGGNAAITITGDAAFDAKAQSFDLSGIRLEAAGLNLSPYVADAVIETSGGGDLSARSVSLRGLNATATLTGGEDRISATLSANADADLNSQQIRLSELTLDVPQLSMKGLQGAIQSGGAGSAVADLAAGTFSMDSPTLSGTLSGDPVPGGSMPLVLDFAIEGDLNRKVFNFSPLTLSAAEISTRMNLDLQQKESGPEIKGTLAVATFNPRDVFTRLGLTPPNTADARALSTAAIDMTFSATGSTASIKDLVLQLDDSKLTGSLGVDNFQAPEASLDLSLDRLQPGRYLPPGDEAGTSRLLSNIALKGDLTADAGFKVFRVARLALSGNLDEKLPFGLTASEGKIDLDAETISANTLALKAGKMALKASAEVTGLSSKPAYSAKVETETFNLREILSDLDALPETADPKAMGAVQLTASLSGTSEAVSVPSVSLRLDETRITGKADLALSPAPAYAFNLAIDSIDADRYLPPPPPETAKAKTPQAATPGVAAAALPVDLLRGLDLDGKLSIGKLKIKNLRLTGIQVQAAAKEGLLTLHPLSAELYSGAYSGNIRLDARGQTPTLSLDETLAGVQSGNLLKDLQGKAVVTGLANAEMKLTAAGSGADALLSSLGGTVSFSFTDGSVKGVDIVGKICRTLSAVNAGTLKTKDLVGNALQKLVQKATGTETTQAAEADSTTFSEMGGSMTFEKGVGTSKDLSLKSPLLRVEGEGSLDLIRQYLDYGATAALVKSCEGQGGESFSDLKNIPIPVTIKGPLTKLEVKPNLTAGILQILARKQSKEAENTSTATTGAKQQEAASQPKEEPETVEDAVKGIFQDLLKKH